MKRFWFILGVSLVVAAIGATSAVAGNLPVDGKRQTIQAFVPAPGLSSNQSINTGSSYTLNTSGYKVVRFYSDKELKVKLNSNTAYFRSYEGYYGIGEDITQIVFTNDSGSTAALDIEGM